MCPVWSSGNMFCDSQIFRGSIDYFSSKRRVARRALLHRGRETLASSASVPGPGSRVPLPLSRPPPAPRRATGLYALFALFAVRAARTHDPVFYSVYSLSLAFFCCKGSLLRKKRNEPQTVPTIGYALHSGRGGRGVRLRGRETRGVGVLGRLTWGLGSRASLRDAREHTDRGRNERERRAKYRKSDRTFGGEL